ncbi:MAG: PIN domain-containing protein [Deltaproteobacteria bacterium]|nr:PIN domain-containing protein [Deltaproteobacteria bacterium]MBW1929164.1 PIN domain-containing protein [Deltaproteobacteria bacterium]MBW2127581.1 PIN domain-containing protein [Deltaproteobacteria bacterium]
MTPLIDTNVIVRFLIGDEDPKYKNLYNFFVQLEQGKIQVELKLIVLFQVIFVLTSFYKIPRPRVAEVLTDLLKYRGIKIKEKKTIKRMLFLWKEHSLDIVDCYLLALLEAEPQNVLYSYDKDFDRFGINRKEP